MKQSKKAKLVGSSGRKAFYKPLKVLLVTFLIHCNIGPKLSLSDNQSRKCIAECYLKDAVRHSPLSIREQSYAADVGVLPRASPPQYAVEG